jgi:predicted DNA binding protein
VQAYVTVGPFLPTLDRISPENPLVADSLREREINVENKKGETMPHVNLNNLTDEQREILREAESPGSS